MTVTSPLTITPLTVNTPQNSTQQFTASAPASWSVGCGTITAGGLFTASAAVGSNCSIEATAASGTKYHFFGNDHITAPVSGGPLTVLPTSATVSEAATQQFTASASATWAASCGSVSSKGLYTAPLAAEACMVTATPTGSGSAASATVTVTSPISITPPSAVTPQNSTQQFTASSSVTWRASCGSISRSGLFTAPATQGACSIIATAASGTAYTATANDNVVSAATFTVSPKSATVSEGATQQFTASASATWTASCGTVSSTGLYTPPLSNRVCIVTATPTAGGGAATATVTVTSPLTITPLTVNTPQNSTQQFTASAPASWSVGCGTITAGGLFTASAAVGSNCSIEATAASGTKYHFFGNDHITAPVSGGPLTVSPTSATVSEGATQQFTASAGATWTASCGSVSSAGLYTAPLAAEACTVTATPTAGGSAASATVAVTSPITISPPSAVSPQNSTQQFTASSSVTWAASCGTISNSGLFTASATQGAICSITATAASGTAYTAIATDTIGPSGVFTISPTSATVSEGATQQFTASASATWTVSCGSVTSSGAYTAPLTPSPCTIAATATDGSGQMASAVATTSSPITLTPATVNLHALNTQSFTSSQPATWTASCGSISSSGLFTAPASPGNCTLTATASSGTPFTAVAAANVDVVNYTAWKGGGGNTGAQTDELLLTPSNVNSSSFGISWTASVDGWVNAQPLYMNGLMINGSPHNVVFVATGNDSVYAFDGDTGAQLWQVSLIPSGATAVAASTVGFNGSPQIGVLSTPVIDPSTNTMYVVSETSEQNATYFPHRLHALDITTGNEKFGGPVLISNPQMAAIHKLQRPGLLLANGSIYIGIGSMQDEQPYSGLLFAFNAQTLGEQAAWVTTPSGIEGGIWMGGAAPSVDENGDIYVATGNGTFDGSVNFGEAAVKFSPGLQVLDYFAPYNFATYDDSNIDLGSGDVMVVPDQSGPYPHELIVCGKPTPIYVLNRDNLGQVGATSDNIIQRLDDELGQLGPGTTLYACYTAPAMWGQNVYFGGKFDVLKMFTLNASTGMLSSSPVSQGALAYGYPGADPVVSANGTTNGIVWTIDTGTSTLRANDAANVANLLYSGALAGGTLSWTVPTVVNGHVYVGEKGTVFAFGLK